MQIKVIIYLLICYLVRQFVAERENVTFENVKVTVYKWCFDENKTSEIFNFNITQSNNLWRELEKGTSIPYSSEGKCVSMENQTIPVIYKSALSGINVNALYITNCGVSEIQSGFLNNTSLGKLYLQGNKLDTIKRDLFAGVSSISILDLSNNSIKSIETGAFRNISVSELHLNHNQIKEVPFGLSTNKSVRYIGLNGNKITKIFKGIFSNSPILSGADLNSNLIEYIQAGAFENTPKLVYINLASNRLKKISDGIFSDRWGIESVIDISNNSIEYIQPGAFDNACIFGLDLHLNELKEIKNGTFSGGSITWLWLRANRIRHIEGGAFSSRGLRKLDLAENDLTIIREGTFTDCYTFRVNLYFNNIGIIEPGAFSSHLDGIYLNDASLNDASKGYIYSLRNVHYDDDEFYTSKSGAEFLYTD